MARFQSHRQGRWLFTLNIFEGKLIVDELIRPDFLRTYLPKVFERFGTIQSPLDTIDRDDSEHGKEIEFKVLLNKLSGKVLTLLKLP